MGLETERATVRKEFEERVDRIESFVNNFGELFTDIATRQGEVVDRIDNFRYHHGRLDKSLVILLLGGTGTGKSTLINALAGREISGTAVRRAYTENYFIYHHRQTPIAFLNPVLGQGDQWFPHDREPLREKVVIDAPDFDSLKTINREKVLSMLDLADMVLCVVTSEKYRDRTLYEILEEVKSLKRFVFVYNKIDREFSEKVVDQLSGELASLNIPADIFKVSALSAFQNAGDGGTRETGDFAKLARVIEDELDHAQIREIKRKNLDGLFTTIQEEVVAAVPEDFDKRVAGFDDRLAQIMNEASSSASKQVIDNVFAEEDGELAGILKSIQYYSFSGVFGFYLAMVDKIRAMRPGYVSVSNMDQFRMRRVLSRHCEMIQLDRIREKMEIAGDAVGRELRELAVSEDMAGKLREMLDAEVFYAGMVDDVTDGLALEFFGQFERYCLGKRRTWGITLRNWIFNMIPTGFILFVLGNLIYKYFYVDTFLGTDYLVSSLLVLLVVCFFVQLAAEKRFAKENWTFLAELQSRVLERVEQFMGRRMGEELAAIKLQIDSIRGEFKAIVEAEMPGGDLELPIMKTEGEAAPVASPAVEPAPTEDEEPPAPEASAEGDAADKEEWARPKRADAKVGEE